MTARNNASAHLKKAGEFLQAAEVTAEQGLHNAAASNAVTSAINSKDAMCLALTGRTNKSDRHEEAVPELRAAGQAGRAVATTFGRLLRLKPKSQYQAVSISAGDAAEATEWAARMYEAAEAVLRG